MFATRCVRGPNAVRGFGNADYFNTPQLFKVAFKTSRFFALIGTSGNRISSSICPSMAKAVFTGAGLLSMNKSLNNG